MQKVDKSTIKKDIVEQTSTYDISISDYDPESAYLELPEELDKKMVTYIEREVRNSYEYRAYVNYLKNELDLTRCSLLPNLDINSAKFSLEFHHYPINLYEISEIVGSKMISDAGEGKKVSCFDIAEKVVEEHYKNNIGLIPLTKTLHEMAHNRAIIVPISKVHGNYKKFTAEYRDFISDEILDRITEAEMNSESDDAKAYNDAKLEKNISLYNVTYNKKTEEDDTDE